ncbi:MAG: YwiC-like family protein [Micrococcales bacterium]|nr:YwiC-like family protein [Micrococcales bacterium]
MSRHLGPGWVPREHGAWAMLVAPVVVGTLLATPSWRHGLLLVTWLVAYCAFAAAGLWLRSGRRAGRYLPPLRFHLVTATVLGVALVVSAPGLLRWAPVFAVLGAASLAASSRRADRSWLNDGVTVLTACAMTVVSAGLRGGWGSSWLPPGAGDGTAWVAGALLVGYFLGTVPYVKTLIRDRGSRRVLAVSIGYHAVLVVTAAAWLVRVLAAGAAGMDGDRGGGAHNLVMAVVLLAVAAGLLGRAALVPRRRPWPKPLAIGIGEIAATLIVVTVTVAAVG